MATRIDADGSVTEIIPRGRVFSLQELQAIVGGDIEAIPTPDGRPMYLNTDGKRLDLPLNARATALVGHTLLPGDYIAGNVVLCTLAETGDDDHDDDEGGTA
jgi:hypothetical protein